MDINSTIPVFEPLTDTITDLMKIVSAFVGGIFGIYVILLIWRVYTFRRNRKFFSMLKKDINDLNISVARIERKIDSIGSSQHRKKGK